MARKNVFQHETVPGSAYYNPTTQPSPWDRMKAEGYNWNGASENIAAGYGTVAAVMAGWASSPGHCANIMSPNYTQLGIACVSGGGSSTFRNYWTMNLARPR
jgi:uncharacterized protein YkwD